LTSKQICNTTCKTLLSSIRNLEAQLQVSRKHGIQVQEEDKFWKTTDEMARNCNRQHDVIYYRFMLIVAFGLLCIRTSISALSEGPALLPENKNSKSISGHLFKLIINSVSFSRTKDTYFKFYSEIKEE